ncbi:MAG: hypothetical protein JO369_01345 [Paucibacter sp.]|nr:hypothetical protein [Roseateles sp.]
MPEKLLTEAEWKKFSKGRDLKDAALLKAMAGYDKARTPEAQLKALPLIEKEVELLRKAGKGDKELVAQLDSMDKALERETKAVKAAEKQAQESEAEEGDEAPDLLTTKMIPLLRQVKKGEELPVMVASDGKKVAVLMSRRAISPSRRKLLQDYLAGSGALKYFLGTCLFEENAYTFVLKTQAAGLAKKLKAGLLEQVNLRLKVRVRGEQPDDVDDDGEEAPPDELEAHENVAKAAAAAAAAAAASAAAAAAAPAPGEADPLEAEYEKRWAVLERRVQAALRQGSAVASKIRAVADFVSAKGSAKQFKAALQGMDSLEKLLEAPPEAAAPTGEAPAPGDRPVNEGAAFNARFAALMPKIKEAMASNGELKAKVTEAGAAASSRQFERAQGLLDEVEDMLAAAGTAPKGEEDPKAAEHRALLARLQPLYDQANGGGLSPEQQASLQKVHAAWNMAEESADAGNFERALTILKRLDEGGLLAGLAGPRPAATTGGGTGRLVRQRSFMLKEWARMPDELHARLQGLRTLLADSEADEDPDGLVDGIEDALDGLLDEIQDTMDQAINDGDTAVFAGLRERARSHALMQHLLTAPDFDGGALLGAVEGALERIERAMLAD